MARGSVALVCVLAWAAPLLAQGLPAAPDPVDVVIERLESALVKGDRAAFASLFGPPFPDAQIQRYSTDLFLPGGLGATVRQRDRAPLEGAPPGDGFQVVVEIFVESQGRARILTAGMGIRRPPGGGLNSWRIVSAEGLSSVDGLYRLRLNTTQAYTARDLEIVSEDLTLALTEGHVFLVECDDGVTGVVLLGRGEMRFAPAPAAERGQLRLFAGTETLATPFEQAFVRISPSDYRQLVAERSLAPAMPDPRLARRAQEVFARESVKSFSVDLQDLSRDLWHVLPPAFDVLAEVRTGRYGTLTYSRASAQAEDVSLYRREDRRTIALYPSVAKLAARGRFYSDDVLRDFDVLDYSVDAAFQPARQVITGRARLSIRVRSTSLTTLMLRLGETLVVSDVESVEHGRLLFLRLRDQNSLLINFPRVLAQDADLTLVVTYAGRLPSQELDVDTVQLRPDDPAAPGAEGLEPAFVFSNRSFWYPQNPVPDYATAGIRVVVPTGYRVVASGEAVEAGGAADLRDLPAVPGGQTFAFRANQPLRYLAMAVSRLLPIASATVSLAELPSASIGVDRLAVAVEMHRSLQSRGRETLRATEDILRFYANLVGDAPYTSTTVAMFESDVPGGHSPGYFVVINSPLPQFGVTWRNDPAAFEGFPEFFLAHELAHQWWGQAVGWKNYHEQWISEGFAQYFAALYAEKARGERTFTDMLRQFRRWSLAESDQGPVHLGYRLGHVKSEPRVFRALVYNKGAAVLHMLRRLLGDDVFFAGVRRLYAERRYQKAGTEDVERAMETVSGRTLDRFFERWIYGTEIPRVTHGFTTSPQEVVVRFEQVGDLVFDLPVTVTLTFADGRTRDVVVPVTDRRVEHRIPVDAAVRQVQFNRDGAALAEFSGR